MLKGSAPVDILPNDRSVCFFWSPAPSRYCETLD
jgi:hypothetical protein